MDQQPLSELGDNGRLIRSCDVMAGSSFLHEAAAKGRLAEVKRLVEHRPGLLVRQRLDGATPLFLAIVNRQEPVVEYLAAEMIPAYLNLATNEGMTPFHQAIEQGCESMALLLLSRGADGQISRRSNGWTPLHTSVFKNSFSVVRRLIEVGANINAPDDVGVTPLYIAAFCGHTEMLKVLMAIPRIDLTLVTQNGSSALHAAADKGHLAVVRLLIEEGSFQATAPRSGDGHTALCVASKNDHVCVVQYLFQLGGWDSMQLLAAFCAAAYHGSRRTVQFFLCQNMSCDFPGLANGMTPFYAGVHSGNVEIVRLFVAYTEQPDLIIDDQGSTPVYVAAMLGHLDVVRFLVEEKNVLPNKARPGGMTPFHAACAHGQLSVIKYLTAKGYNPLTSQNFLNPKSPLYAAVESGREDLVRFLILELGPATVHALTTQQKKWGLQTLAAQRGHLAIVVFLTAQLTQNDCDCGLLAAAQHGHLEVVRYLVRKFMTMTRLPGECRAPSARELREWRAVAMGAVQGAIQIAQLSVLDWLQAAQGWTAIHFACDAGDANALIPLLSETVDLDQVDGRGHSLFEIAEARILTQSPSLPPISPRMFWNNQTEFEVDLPRTMEVLRSAMGPWTVASHGLFPPKFRNMVKVMLLMSTFHFKGAVRLPFELWCSVIAYYSRKWLIEFDANSSRNS